jgi:hypothetical protein
MNSPSNNYWFMFKHFCPKENHNYTYNSNYPKNKHFQKALSSTLRRPQKCTTPLQSSTLRRAWTCTKPTVICSKTQNFSALQKASLQKRKNAEEETQTQNSNYHKIYAVNRTQSRILQITMLLNGVWIQRLVPWRKHIPMFRRTLTPPQSLWCLENSLLQFSLNTGLNTGSALVVLRFDIIGSS